MSGILALLISLYGVLQLSASFAGWRNHRMATPVFLMMAGGSLLLPVGAGIQLSGSAIGVWLVGIGLGLISLSAYCVGLARPEGPNYRHHLVRIMIALVLLSGVVLLS
jgi:hypothetical protein